MRFFLFFWATQLFAAFNLTWGTPALSLDSNPPVGDTDSNAYIAMDAEGNAVATWSRTTDKRASERIWAAVYNHSLRTWTGAVKISGSGSASNSQTAVDPSGNAIFVWEEGFPTRIHYRTLGRHGVWSPDLSKPAAVIAASKNAQTSPQIAIDGRGNALSIWTEFFGGKHHLFSSTKPANGSWSESKEIGAGLNNVSLIPSKALVINEAGDGLAVWEESGNEVYAARFVEGRWLPPFAIANENATSPTAGIDSESDIVIVWTQNGTLFSKTIQKGALLPSPITVSDPTYKAEHPSVVLDAAGNATVVFERYNSMHKFIASATLTKGAQSWTKPLDISGPSPADAKSAGYPVCTMNAIGDAVVIWKEWTGTNMVIQGAGFSLGTWSSIKTLSSQTGCAGGEGCTYDISVALNLAGHILAIWPEDPLVTGAHQIKATGSTSPIQQNVPITPAKTADVIEKPQTVLAKVEEIPPLIAPIRAPQIISVSGVGLANTGPMPPMIDPSSIMNGIVTGKQVLHKFPAHSDLINILNWETPSNVAYFNVYRENLASRIGTTKQPYYEDHQRTPKQQVTYLITSVDPFGQESTPITFVVSPR